MKTDSRLRQLTLLALLLAPLPTALAAPDIEKGKVLHDKQCVSCHVERYGGDGAQMYLRPNRLIRDRAALGQRVAMCSTMIKAGLFPEDEENIAAYLAQRFYKFK